MTEFVLGALGLFALYLTRSMWRYSARRKLLQEFATKLEFRFVDYPGKDPAGDRREHVQGSLFGFPITIAQSRGNDRIEFLIHGVDSIPWDLTFMTKRPQEPHPSENALEPPVLLHDGVMDQRVEVRGDKCRLFALFNEKLRDQFVRDWDNLNISLQESVIRWDVSSDAGADQMISQLQRTIEVARALKLRDVDIPDRLLRNAKNDSCVKVREQNLALLQEHYGGSGQAVEASRALQNCDEPALRLMAAGHLGDEGFETLTSIVGSTAIANSIRHEAIQYLTKQLKRFTASAQEREWYRELLFADIRLRMLAAHHLGKQGFELLEATLESDSEARAMQNELRDLVMRSVPAEVKLAMDPRPSNVQLDGTQTYLMAGRILGADGFETLEAMIHSEELASKIRSAALLHLSRHFAPERVIPFLELALLSPTGGLRITAIEIVGRLKHRPAIDRLAELAENADSDTAVAIANALEQIGEPSSEAVLIKLLACESKEAKAAAVQALGVLGTAAAVEPLLALKKWYSSTGGLAAYAIRRIQLRLGHVEPGRLSTISLPKHEGGLALTSEEGQLSIPQDSDGSQREELEEKPDRRGEGDGTVEKRCDP